MIVKQIFNPPLGFCKNNCHDVQSVTCREWTLDATQNSIQSSDTSYIGSRQIEEVWKHYFKNYYISNYGYVVKIKPEAKNLADKLIPDELKKSDENSLGLRWLDFSKELKELFRENAFVPKNRGNSGCQICLNITGKTPQYDVHKIVARFFLKKPEDFDKIQYVVHHIDNNSYNNSVTNLIYLPSDTHQIGQSQIYHPLSYK